MAKHRLRIKQKMTIDIKNTYQTILLDAAFIGLRSCSLVILRPGVGPMQSAPVLL